MEELFIQNKIKSTNISMHSLIMYYKNQTKNLLLLIFHYVENIYMI